nr:uncharacterized mitochondrial protein AtMg00810-like [Hydra vulgaris]
MESVRILMQLSMQYDLILHQMDVKSAYLHGPFLGIQFKSTSCYITMNQSDYLQNVLQKFGFDNCKPRSTPCKQVPNSYHNQESIKSNDSEIKLYRQMVGSLLYAMTCTRPDLSYVVT